MAEVNPKVLYKDLKNWAEGLDDSVDCWVAYNRDIYIKGNKLDVMVRTNVYSESFNGIDCVIARVFFPKELQGKGLFKQLEGILVKNNAKSLGIESILTSDMLKVAKHLGYKQALKTNYCRDYVKTLD